MVGERPDRQTRQQPAPDLPVPKKTQGVCLPVRQAGVAGQDTSQSLQSSRAFNQLNRPDKFKTPRAESLDLLFPVSPQSRARFGDAAALLSLSTPSDLSLTLLCRQHGLSSLFNLCPMFGRFPMTSTESTYLEPSPRWPCLAPFNTAVLFHFLLTNNQPIFGLFQSPPQTRRSVRPWTDMHVGLDALYGTS